jgi:hypothetical protein
MWYPNIAGASVITEPQADAQVAVGAKNVTRVHFCIDRVTYFDISGQAKFDAECLALFDQGRCFLFVVCLNSGIQFRDEAFCHICVYRKFAV